MKELLKIITDNVQWIFSGIGTQILSIFMSFVAGYFLGVKRTIKQQQKGGYKAEQHQELIVNSDKRAQDALLQIQKGSSESKQTQIGEINVREKQTNSKSRR